jgi:AcrR family transcriptional regulator
MSQTPQNPTTADRRVKRSQQALLEALVQLMIEKGFEQTTIADIAERANVGRSTFYAHFADKEALLRESLQGLRAYLTQAGSAPPRADVHPALAFSLPMLEHVEDSKDLFAAIVSRRSTAVDMLQSMLVELVSDTLAPQLLLPGVSSALTAEHIVGSFLSICRWWMTEATTLSAVEVDRAFRQLMAGLGHT